MDIRDIYELVPYTRSIPMFDNQNSEDILPLDYFEGSTVSEHVLGNANLYEDI